MQGGVNFFFFFFLEARVTRTDHMNQATQGSEQKLPATWQTGARHGRRCGHTALLQLGGKLSLLKQGPAAAHPRQKSGTIGLSIPVADEKNLTLRYGVVLDSVIDST